jgi:heptaprenyl diphosphate synthase
MRPLTDSRTDDHPGDRELAFFGALCLFLSGLEFLVPKPLPFLRLGLANLPLLLALRLRSSGFVLALAGLKVLGQGIVQGTLFSYIFLFSSAGSLASVLAMLGLARIFEQRMSLAGIGVLGAFASNAAQLVFARFFLLGEGAWSIAPPFLLAGTAAGFFLGILAQKMLEESAWVAVLAEGNPEAADRAAVPGTPEESRRAAILALCGLGAAAFLLFTESMWIRLALAGAFALLASLCGARFRLLPNLAAALPLVLSQLLAPWGKIYFSLGSFPVTEGALLRGISKTATILGLVYISRLTVRPALRFPGRPGGICADMLRYCELITESVKISREGAKAALPLREKLDAILEELWRKGRA